MFSDTTTIAIGPHVNSDGLTDGIRMDQNLYPHQIYFPSHVKSFWKIFFEMIYFQKKKSSQIIYCIPKNKFR